MWVYLRGLIALGGGGTDRDRLELGLVLSWDKRDRCARVEANRKSSLSAIIIIYVIMIYNSLFYVYKYVAYMCVCVSVNIVWVLM